MAVPRHAAILLEEEALGPELPTAPADLIRSVIETWATVQVTAEASGAPVDIKEAPRDQAAAAACQVWAGAAATVAAECGVAECAAVAADGGSTNDKENDHELNRI